MAGAVGPGFARAILSAVLRWPIRLASVLLTAALAYGWGDLVTDPGPLRAVVVVGSTVVLGVALARLYRPGGPAAFEWDDEGERGLPEVPMPVSSPRAARFSRIKPAPGQAPQARPAAPPLRPTPRRASGGGTGSRASGSLWSRDRDPER